MRCLNEQNLQKQKQKSLTCSFVQMQSYWRRVYLEIHACASCRVFLVLGDYQAASKRLAS